MWCFYSIYDNVPPYPGPAGGIPGGKPTGGAEKQNIQLVHRLMLTCYTDYRKILNFTDYFKTVS